MTFAHLIPAEDEPIHRRAPHNIEVEQALLGAILINNEAFFRVSDFLEPAHFFDRHPAAPHGSDDCRLSQHGPALIGGWQRGHLSEWFLAVGTVRPKIVPGSVTLCIRSHV